MPTIVEDQELDKDVRHGYTDQPRSRAYWCAQNGGCGPISSEPQSVEAPKGFPRTGPPDGQLASGGIGKFGVLDGINAPNGQPWPATRVAPSSLIRVRWWLTATHKTERWQYWITKDGWNPNQPLSRAQLEPEPFSNFEWPCPSGGWTCHMPIQNVHHFMYLPPKQGRHVIYAIWVVGDTGNAFHQAIDVQFDPTLSAGDIVEHDA